MWPSQPVDLVAPAQQVECLLQDPLDVAHHAFGGIQDALSFLALPVDPGVLIPGQVARHAAVNDASG
ncbi:MAG TPA: hypothetical protein VGQ42_12160 [Candidatus Dormibacteraeota bacterium]|nr:hypothetical protein [Candidatus Dormibacteraeota bacterium]